MRASEFDEIEFFRAIDANLVRALLIGRRALVVLGFPLLTADYDFWLHIDDIERFNALTSVFELTPTLSPEDARRRGRYALENDEHVDVLIARAVPTVDGHIVSFDDVWNRRRKMVLTSDVSISLPSHADLVSTKRFSARPKDLEDIRLLELIEREPES